MAKKRKTQENFVHRPTYDQLRQNIAEVIAEERELPSMSGSQSLAGLTDDEVTADRILVGIRECRFFVYE
jgi:hypothetical protein